MNILFDMETGDPDDLITLLLLLANPDVQLRAVTCWQGSPIQIGLIKHVLALANVDIPIGGLNESDPKELSPYYTDVVGQWNEAFAIQTPSDVFTKILEEFPDTKVLTGAPLTNLAKFLENTPIHITEVVSQGGYLGDLVSEPLAKFRGKSEIRTYNLTNDTDAFSIVNSSTQIEKLTFVTKDLCHGFMYTPELHNSITFGSSPIQQMLFKCLNRYALAGKSKAMHDPLAMLYLIYPEIGSFIPINMSFRVDSKGDNVFSSILGNGSRFGLNYYNKELAWNKFSNLCRQDPVNYKKLDINT